MDRLAYTAKLSVESPEFARQRVSASVILGSPDKNCSGHGICRVVVPPLRNELGDCCWAPATIYLASANALRFVFPKERMSERVRRNHFAEPFFPLDANVALPASLKPGVGNVKFELTAGHYPIVENENDYEIVFRVVESAR